ncbi:MAG: alpha-glucosidase [Bacteroidales bacterium]|nr:alpha-glucosidase [Bacteroidales bacterium]MDD3892263.1 alpha-glucosidase [Bacteroidales bacterium]
MIRNCLLYSSILIILITTSCTDDKPKWWKETVFYQIYMPSFQDSDGDGYSDFVGITSRLDYLDSLGVKGIWLTPFYTSPKVDNGYDIANYYQVDSTYGTLDDFKTFINVAHSKDIKVIIDMVVNHSSIECEWFQESRKSIDNPYRNYYIWHDEPNNWESFFGGSAWEYDSVTNQYYYHQFDTTMADLNWSNPNLVEEIQNVLRFWLDLGVDGFRLDVINFLTTDGITLDNPISNGKQEHIYDVNQPSVKDAIRLIKATISEHDNKFVVGEIGSDKLKVLSQYQSPELMDVVFNFNFGSIPEFSVQRIFEELQNMEDSLSEYPTLFFGSHDMPRLINRLAKGDTSLAKALAALIITAKGVPFIYYGEEIGMQNIEANAFNEIVDIQAKTQYNIALNKGLSSVDALAEANKHNRDRSRSPMQWNGTHNAGFSSDKPWIRINDNYVENNVEALKDVEESIFNTYKNLIALRNKEKTLQYGQYETLKLIDNRIHFTRFYQGDRITIIINFCNPIEIDLPKSAEILMGESFIQKNEFLIFKH